MTPEEALTWLAEKAWMYVDLNDGDTAQLDCITEIIRKALP